MTLEGSSSFSTMTALHATTRRSPVRSSLTLETLTSPCRTVTIVLLASSVSTKKSAVSPVGMTTTSAVGEITVYAEGGSVRGNFFLNRIVP